MNIDIYIGDDDEHAYAKYILPIPISTDSAQEVSSG